MSVHDEWLDVVKNVYEKNQQKGGFQILFPEYRPDLSHALAHHLDMEFYDYRESTMISEGWNAGNISLDSMTENLLKQSEKSPVLVHNVEALLAAKSTEERQKWLVEFLSIDWPNPIIIPLAIYQADTLEGHSHVCDIESIEFPKQSFLMRLAM